MSFNSIYLIKFILIIASATLLFSCISEEPKKQKNELSFELRSMSEFGYKGTAIVRELSQGDLEIEILLEGEKSNIPYFFPAHLHVGDYQQKESPMAAMLNPVSILDLKSTTVINQLGNGKKITWNDFQAFEGHIKVHLASEGPDYHVILVAGNVGKIK